MTGVATGYQGIVTTGDETTYGTVATSLDRSFEVLPNESIGRRNRVIKREGMRGGTLAGYTETRRIVTGRDAGGAFTTEVLPVGFGRFLRQLMGSSAITQQGVTAAWLQAHTYGSLSARSLTIQKQIKDEDGSSLATFTDVGCKFLSGEFVFDTDKTLQATFDVDAQDELVATAAAAAAYPAASVDPFHFAQASLTLGGSALANVAGGRVKITRALNVERRHLGNAGLKTKPIEEARPTVAGSIRTEFLDRTLYDLFAADGGGTLVVLYTGANIASTYDRLIRITVPLSHLVGETPKLSSPGILPIEIPFEADPGGVLIEYQSTDTTI
jgi:hypothetical protein